MGTATTAVDTAVAVTITDGTEAAVTTEGTTIAAGKAFAGFAFRHSHCPDDRRIVATRTVAPSRRGRFSDPTVNDAARRSAEPHLHRDPDQVRVILGAELLLEQRGGVGHRLVGNLQRIGDFDDLVAAAQ